MGIKLGDKKQNNFIILYFFVFCVRVFWCPYFWTCPIIWTNKKNRIIFKLKEMENNSSKRKRKENQKEKKKKKSTNKKKKTKSKKEKEIFFNFSPCVFCLVLFCAWWVCVLLVVFVLFLFCVCGWQLERKKEKTKKGTRGAYVDFRKTPPPFV